MNYELAKRLKDAGFQLKKSKVHYCDNECKGDCNEEIVIIDGIYYWTPTLSELIEACGSGLDIILRQDGGVWKVGRFGYEPHATGSTIIEAVAELWLKLNQK